MVDFTWASSPNIEPVASRQKQISMKPKAGIDRSFEGIEDLWKTVLFETIEFPEGIGIAENRG